MIDTGLTDSPALNLQTALFCAHACQDAYGTALDAADYPLGAVLERVSDYQYLHADLGPCQLIAVRGTDNLANWFTDARCEQVKTPFTSGLLHRGFAEAAAILWSHISQHLLPKPALLTGHSLGGAVASILALHLMNSPWTQTPARACCTFGSPRVGNAAFTTEYSTSVPQSWRVVHGRDCVPGLPLPLSFVWPHLTFYEHVGMAKHFMKDGSEAHDLRMLARTEVMLAGVTDVRGISQFDDHLIVNYIAAIEKAVRA